jgi:hypothetical protein
MTTRPNLTARAGQCLNRMGADSFHRKAMADWHGILASDFPLTPDTMNAARQNVEWAEDMLKRRGQARDIQEIG